MDYPKKSDTAKQICKDQQNRNLTGLLSRQDPCDSCPLKCSCIKMACVAPGLDAYTTWINGINKEAENISVHKLSGLSMIHALGENGESNRADEIEI